ncbi:glucose 1-dehydrogenase [Sphingomonas sabuli]|uniref:Glucose 1-dehydrogenase n=1 Tax=Sphingomonas sabuli TaxID=2764186 RepID=A0A7G9KZM2_9SPHN|nr:glucose 1-dehydrogenase [Sphingomonas sabuli]QNM81821.1 glucose 1-dehydrogenase [Sphingomonas sabuli]
MAKLKDKVAIVTGASKGIGAGIARSLAAEGASVVVNYASSKDGADAVVNAIKGQGGKAIAVKGDISNEAEAAALVDAAIGEFGQIDILVNNSGVYGFSAIENVDVDEYRRQFDINVLGTLLTTKAAVPHLKSGASVINISSNITSVLVPESAIYSGTKGAVDAITGVLAKELAPRGIRVNAILPGYTETEGTGAAGISGTDFVDQIVAQTPLGRAGHPDDVAKVAVFLASNDSGWLTGEKVNASGGMR